MINYEFTQNWFSHKDLEKFILPDINPNNELHILEIGSFEGKSTVWWAENLLVNSKSTITCLDPWISYIQNSKSYSEYDKDTAGYDISKGEVTMFGVEDRFLANIKKSKKSNQINIRKGFSFDVLPKLNTENKKFDIIFIDGNHTSPFVITDAVFSWYLLNRGGIMIFDDYLWGNPVAKGKPTLSPKLAIDSFINIFSDYIEIIYSAHRKAIKRII